MFDYIKDYRFFSFIFFIISVLFFVLIFLNFETKNLWNDFINKIYKWGKTLYMTVVNVFVKLAVLL